MFFCSYSEMFKMQLPQPIAHVHGNIQCNLDSQTTDFFEKNALQQPG